MDVFELKGKVLRIIDKRVYFFNEEGIYERTSIIGAKDKKLKNLGFNGNTGQYYITKSLYAYFPDIYSIAVERAAACLSVGDSIQEFNQNILKFEKLYKTKKFELTNTVFRIRGGRFYFFDENEKYTCLKEKEILPSNIFIGEVFVRDAKHVSYYCDLQVRQLAKVLDVTNLNILRKALGKLNVGDTLDILKEYCNGGIILEKTNLPDGLERFVTRIQRPEFVCEPENPNKYTTFDYIHVYVGIIEEWKTDRKKYIEEHKKEITKMVFDKIEKDRTFLKYGIPINFLKVSKITLVKRTSEIHYVLVIKDINNLKF